MAVSRPAPKSQFRRLCKAIASLACVVFIVAACSSDGHPDDFADQVDEDTGLSNVEGNWLQGCQVAYDSANEARSTPFSRDAATVCQCSYDAITADAEGSEPGLLFEDFRSIDDEVGGDRGALGNENPSASELRLVEIVSTCLGA